MCEHSRQDADSAASSSRDSAAMPPMNATARRARDCASAETTQLTLFAVDSLAKTSATPATPPGLRRNGAGCSSSSCESLAFWDRESLSWKMWQRSLLTDWTPFSVASLRSGSMRNGRLFRRAPWGRHTHASVCSSLPTVTKSDGTGLTAILTDEMEFFTDAGTGKPRRRAPSGGTWSIGLSRLFRMATGNHLRPKFTEWLMGFPNGWASMECLATPSSGVRSMTQRDLFAEPLPAYLQTGGSPSVPGGEQLKKDGMARAAAAKNAELAHARIVARAIALNRGTVTADEVIAAIGKSLGNAAGSLFTGGEFEWTGERVKSQRAHAHQNELKVWRLKT